MLELRLKETVPDVRNTKIVDVIAALADYGIIINIYDPTTQLRLCMNMI
jgi:UDP-N-acetyl-D-galactosamine dehydrogenase